MPAARTTPLQPNTPNSPALGGTSGVRLSPSMNVQPATTNTAMTASLIATMTALARADSRIPVTRMPVIASETTTAGRLNRAVTVDPSESAISVPGVAVSRAGTCRPKSARKLVM